MKKFKYLLVIALFILSCPAFALTGQVIRVPDGDTIVVRDARRVEHRVRLAAIDAPEMNQPYGRESRHNLFKLLYNQIVEVVETTSRPDRYGRVIGMVMVGSVNANEQQVRDGYAWAYRRYLRIEDQYFVMLETVARQNRRGLWADPNPVPPWDWRRR